MQKAALVHTALSHNYNHDRSHADMTAIVQTETQP